MIVKHERPGVYSSYEASTVVLSRGGQKVVGAVGQSALGTAGKVVRVTSVEQAAAEFGANSGGVCLVELVRLALLNGAAAVAAVAAAVGAEPTEAEYAAAFAKLETEDHVELVVCGSSELAVQQALRESVKAASDGRRERIAVVGSDGENVNELVERAKALNSERVVLTAPNAVAGDGSGTLSGVAVAAAVAGAIAAENDPAVPLGGAVVRGFGGLDAMYSDNELDTLIRGGVTPLECVGGELSVVRGITTRTKTGESEDATWRELTTILIVDDVIPTIRNSLRAKFSRSKNTVQTRGAVRSQVILDLEAKLAGEIITGYDEVMVSVGETQPSVCLVDFGFTVAHGLNQIHLTAHITI
ncbi:MAG: phage tail sheath protein [Oscillospiraceae bacterium]|nr:phage tail sheath protein [Oscillospiraceae bacterium]